MFSSLCLRVDYILRRVQLGSPKVCPLGGIYVGYSPQKAVLIAKLGR